jgi:putative cell wall-binding protein
VLVRSFVTAVLSLVVVASVMGAPLPTAWADVVHEAVGEVVEGLPEVAAPDPGEALDAGARAFSATDPAAADGGIVLSEPVETPIPFSLVGFGIPDGAAVELRTSIDGATWTAWTVVDVHPEEGPDPGSPEAAAAEPGRTASQPVWVDEASHLQLRVLGASPADVDVHLIDTKGLSLSTGQRFRDALASAWRGAGTPAAAEVSRPSIVTREQWGANESWRRGSNSVATSARALFVHHTVNGNGYSQSEARGLVQGIYRYHTQHNGWSDIGYNLLVDRFGTIYEGRHGGLERAVIGAHAGGFNTSSVGIAVIGDFSNVAPGSAARRGLETILAWKADVHHIDPTSKVTMTSAGSTRYPSGRSVSLDAISGHRDVSATACPGQALYGQLPGIRSSVAAAVGDQIVEPDIGPTNHRLTSSTTRLDEVSFEARMKPAGAWTLRITDSAGRVVHTADGSGSTVRATWRPPVRADVYRYRLAAPGRRAVEGDITVLLDVVERTATAGSPVAASVELSQAAFTSRGSAEHAVLARADVFADAMAGGPLAGTGGPLLLGSSGELDAAVRRELERVLPEGRTVYVLGGTAALSDGVADALAERWTVERISGRERTETAAKVADVVRRRSGTTTVMLARSGPDDVAPWADALAGGAYGAKEGIPVLLTPTDALTPPTRAALSGVERTLVLGGAGAVSDAVAAQVPNATRISGKDRTGTAVAIAERLWGRTSGSAGDVVLVADGYSERAWTLPLAASPLARTMSLLNDLLDRAGLGQDVVEHLQLLLSDWQILADLSFADLLLFVHHASRRDARVPVRRSDASLHRADDLPRGPRRPDLPRDGPADGRPAFTRRVIRDADPDWSTGVPVREEAIPVRFGDEVIAVVTREANVSTARSPSNLELTYLQSAGRARADARGRDFPFPGDALRRARAVPAGRRRDHALDGEGRVTYASPNAISAYRRLGSASRTSSGSTSPTSSPRPTEMPRRSAGEPLEMEIERQGAVVLRRLLPLLRDAAVTGGSCSSARSPSCAATSGPCASRTRRSARSITG